MVAMVETDCSLKLTCTRRPICKSIYKPGNSTTITDTARTTQNIDQNLPCNQINKAVKPRPDTSTVSTSLPSNSRFTEKLIQQFHHETLHQGVPLAIAAQHNNTNWPIFNITENLNIKRKAYQDPHSQPWQQCHHEQIRTVTMPFNGANIKTLG